MPSYLRNYLGSCQRTMRWHRNFHATPNRWWHSDLTCLSSNAGNSFLQLLLILHWSAVWRPIRRSLSAPTMHPGRRNSHRLMQLWCFPWSLSNYVRSKCVPPSLRIKCLPKWLRYTHCGQPIHVLLRKIKFSPTHCRPYSRKMLRSCNRLNQDEPVTIKSFNGKILIRIYQELG